METLKIKIVVLWVAVICGFALHTLADLLPLFWGENITIERQAMRLLDCLPS